MLLLQLYGKVNNIFFSWCNNNNKIGFNMTADVYFKQILKNIKGCPRLCAFVLQTHV